MLHAGAGRMFCFLRLHHVSDYRRRAAGTAAASQEGEEEGEDTSRSVGGSGVFYHTVPRESCHVVVASVQHDGTTAAWPRPHGYGYFRSRILSSSVHTTQLQMLKQQTTACMPVFTS